MLHQLYLVTSWSFLNHIARSFIPWPFCGLKFLLIALFGPLSAFIYLCIRLCGWLFDCLTPGTPTVEVARFLVQKNRDTDKTDQHKGVGCQELKNRKLEKTQGLDVHVGQFEGILRDVYESIQKWKNRRTKLVKNCSCLFFYWNLIQNWFVLSQRRHCFPDLVLISIDIFFYCLVCIRHIVYCNTKEFLWFSRKWSCNIPLEKGRVGLRNDIFDNGKLSSRT